jgi:flagellar biosynthesis/type III secretory pathway protein FliH
MKATPIAQYLEQRGRSAALEWSASRREPSPFKPRIAAGAAAPEEEWAEAPSGFRRSGLIAAVPSRATEAPERSPATRAEAEAARRESPFFRARESAPGPDLETRLAEAYHRGVQEGLDTAREEGATTRALERAELQKRAVVERLDFQMNEYAKLAEAIATAFSEVERRVADSVARILQPFVTEGISSQIVEELARAISRLRQGERPGLMRIRGPERLLAALKPRIGSLAVDVEYSVEEGIEVLVEASDTTIASGLQPWADLIGSLVDRS